jgi:hypothetical protein
VAKQKLKKLLNKKMADAIFFIFEKEKHQQVMFFY